VPAVRMLPLALLAMLGMVLPSVAGWGPREGVTAWVFAAAGLGAERGAATAVAYGVLALAAGLPGGLVLAAGLLPRRRPSQLGGRRPVVVRGAGATDA
jgi:glycosyltransferase 2 family protein